MAFAPQDVWDVGHSDAAGALQEDTDATADVARETHDAGDDGDVGPSGLPAKGPSFRPTTVKLVAADDGIEGAADTFFATGTNNVAVRFRPVKGRISVVIVGSGAGDGPDLDKRRFGDASLPELLCGEWSLSAPSTAPPTPEVSAGQGRRRSRRGGDRSCGVAGAIGGHVL